MLHQNFFDRPTIIVAKNLLGKFLVRRYRGQEIALMITEVEAYDGPHDRASHASRGMTPRTRIMFGDPGYFYVYFTYGMHWLVNIVTGPKGYPAAVLLRAGVLKNKYGDIFVQGPARLTKAIHLDGALNCSEAAKSSGLWFEDRGVKISKSKIVATKRIGVDYAGEWKEKLYRFYLNQGVLVKYSKKSPAKRRMFRTENRSYERCRAFRGVGFHKSGLPWC